MPLVRSILDMDHPAAGCGDDVVLASQATMKHLRKYLIGIVVLNMSNILVIVGYY